MVGIALADDERRNQFGVRVQRDKRPDIAIVSGAVGVLTLCTDEAPNLIHLDLLAFQAAHLFIHDLLAGITHTHAEIHNRVPIDAGHALNAADAVAFGKHGNHSDFLFK